MSQESPDTGRPSRLGSILWRLTPLLVIALGAAALWASGFMRAFSPESLMASREAVTHWVAQHQALAMLAFVATYTAYAALCIPGAALLTIASGFLFGAFLGVILSVLAATLGATLFFLAARTSVGDLLRERAGQRLARLRRGFQDDAASYMLFLRLTPAFPFWLVNFASALLGVELKTFIWTTLLGVAPATLVFAYAGVGLDSVVAAHQAAYESCVASGAQSCIMRVRPSDLITRELLLALVALGLLALLPVLAKRWRSRRKSVLAGKS